MKSQEELVQVVLDRSKMKDGRKTLTCTEAFQLAAETGVALIEIGRICNEQDIRLCRCQLGCFS